MGKDCEILVNHMYSGDFLKNDNIGHEIINLYKADNGCHYVYAMTAGDYAYSHKNKVKEILLVRNVDEYVAEVLAKAEVEEDIFGANLQQKYVMLPGIEEIEKMLKNGENSDKIDMYKENHRLQEKYIKKNDVKYGGVYIDDIFKSNSIDNLGHSIFLTYKVKKFRKPKCKLFITDNRKEFENNADTIYIKLECYDRMCGACMASFKPATDEGLRKVFDGPYWEEKDSSDKVNVNSAINSTSSVLNVIGKKNDELTFSNWIAFYLKNDKELLKKFYSEVLKINTTIQNVQVIRESKENIDIYIEDLNNIIVIENKIKSSINGKKKKGKQTIEEKEYSQLAKYFDFAEKEAIKGSLKKETHYYLLLPNYAYKDLNELKHYDKFDKYKVIRYKELANFFDTQKTKLPYFDDFKKALRYHCNEYVNDLYVEMEERFASAIILNR